MTTNSSVTTLCSVRTGASRGRQAYRRLPVTVVIVGMLCGVSVANAEIAYDSHEIDIGDAKVLMAFVGQLTGGDFNDIALFKREGQVRQVSVYSYDGGTFSQLMESNAPARFAMDTWDSERGTALLIPGRLGLNRFNPATGVFEPWLNIRGDNEDQEQDPQQTFKAGRFMFNFARDLNNDGLDDLLSEGEQTIAVWIQRPDGSLANPVVLSSNPIMDFRLKHLPNAPLNFVYAQGLLGSFLESDEKEQGGYEESGILPQTALYAMDYDGDGRVDLAVPFHDQEDSAENAREKVEDEEEQPAMRGNLAPFGLWVHHGLDDGGWSTEAIRVPAPTPLYFTPFDGALFAVQDINADRVADVVVSAADYESRSSRMLFYFGRREHDRTVFPETEDTSVVTKGTLLLTELSDLDRDGDLDFCTVPLKLGVGTMIGGFLRRSMNVELLCYRLTEGAYPKEPSQSWRIRMRLNAPVPMTLADVTGDGLLDIVAPTGLKQLEIYPGTGDAQLFATESTKIELDLPKGRGSLLFRDINRDGRADMLVVPKKSGDPVWVALSR